MATDLEDISLGELGRRMTDLSATLKDGLREMKDEVARRPSQEALDHVKATLGERIDTLAARVSRSEAWGTWIGRLVGAAVAVALLGNVIKPT